MGQNELRSLARARVRSGQLPCKESPTVWAGAGSGEACSLCGAPVSRDQTEYEVLVHADSGDYSLRFHVPCHGIWTEECSHLTLPKAG